LINTYVRAPVIQPNTQGTNASLY